MPRRIETSFDFETVKDGVMFYKQLNEKCRLRLCLSFSLLMSSMICIGLIQAVELTISVPEGSPEIDFALERLEQILDARQISMKISQERTVTSPCTAPKIRTRTVMMAFLCAKMA